MVHVKTDTKQNLCASRTQSPAATAATATQATTPELNETASNEQNVSYASPILSDSSTKQLINSSVDKTKSSTIPPPLIPYRNQNLDNNATSQPISLSCSENNELLNDVNPTVNSENVTSSQVANDELINFTNSNFIERILSRLRWRRERTKASSNNNNTDNDTNGQSKSNKRAVNLLRATGWFGSGKSTNSSTGLFDRRHHLEGIQCTDGGKYIFILHTYMKIIETFIQFFFHLN